MIPLNELRLGNWFYPGFTDKSGKLKPDIVRQILESVPPDTFIEPIPLTPDILEKAGFTLLPQKKSIYIKGRLKLWLGHNGAIAYLKHEDNDNSYYIPNNPQSLHQLQNLYFALTGNELEINL